MSANRLTVFSDWQGTAPEVRPASYTDLVRLVTEPKTYSDKNSCPLLAMATFGDNATSEGCYRSNENLREITGVVIDYDGKSVPLFEAILTLGMRGIRAVGHTSASHTKEAPRWRLLIPTSKALPKDQHGRLTARINGLLGGLADDASFTISQSYYFGRVEGVEYEALATGEIGTSCIDAPEHASLDAGAIWSRRKAANDSAQPAENVIDPDLRPAITSEQLQDLRSALLHLAGGGHGEQYSDWSNIGHCLKSAEKNEGGKRAGELLALWLEYSAALPKFKGVDAAANKWEQLKGDHAGIAGIFQRAQELGWINPAKARHSVIDMGKAIDDAVPNKSRYTLKTAAEMRELPPIEWFIKGILPAKGLAAIYGASTAGKTFIALDMARHLATGKSWFGRRVKLTNVVYIGLEGEYGLSQRTQAIEQHYGEKLPDQIGFLYHGFSITKPQDIKDISQVVPSGAAIIIDTLNRAAPGADENSSVDMGLIIDAAKQLQRLTDGLVILVHHTGKNSDAGLRGHSSLPAALDASIEVKRDGEVRSWKVAKGKDGADGFGSQFGLEVVNLGTDTDGDPITSCVIVPGTFEGAAPAKLTHTQQGVLAALKALAQAGGHCGQDEWRAEFCKGVEDPKARNTKRQAFNRARDALLDAGAVFKSPDGSFVPAENLDTTELFG
jgi:hypothetical protein